MNGMARPSQRGAPQAPARAVEPANGRAGSSHVGRAAIRSFRAILIAIGWSRHVRATDLFPGFDDKQLRDIGLRVDQVVSIDALCQEELHGASEASMFHSEASAEKAAERRTRVQAETVRNAPADRIATSRWRNTS